MLIIHYTITRSYKVGIFNIYRLSPLISMTPITIVGVFSVTLDIPRIFPNIDFRVTFYFTQ